MASTTGVAVGAREEEGRGGIQFDASRMKDERARRRTGMSDLFSGVNGESFISDGSWERESREKRVVSEEVGRGRENDDERLTRLLDQSSSSGFERNV